MMNLARPIAAWRRRRQDDRQAHADVMDGIRRGDAHATYEATDRLHSIERAPNLNGTGPTGSLVDLLATAKKQMDVASLTFYKLGVSMTDLQYIAAYLNELVTHGQELAGKAARALEDAPRSVRAQDDVDGADVELGNTERLLHVAISTTSEATVHLNRMDLSRS
jgi:hypothetical protein